MIGGDPAATARASAAISARAGTAANAAPASRVVDSGVRFSLSLLAALTAAGTSGAERPRIAVEHSRSDAATRRVLAEVRNAGLDPVDVHRTERAGDVSQLADRYRAVAVLSLKHAGRIELAVLSPETREVIYESTVTSKGGTPASVRAAEELHGRLIDLPRREQAATLPSPEPVAATTVLLEDSEPSVPQREPPHTKQLPPEPRREGPPIRDHVASVDRNGNRRPGADERPSFWAGAGAGAQSGIGGLNQVPVIRAEARFEPIRYVGVSVFGLLPVTAQSVAAPEGSAELKARIVAGMLQATWLNVGDVLRVSTGAGGGAAIVSMSGRATSAGLDGRSTSATTGVGILAMGVSARVLPWLALRADATGGLSAYKPVMRVDGRDVATWGPRTLAFTGGLEIDALGFGSSSR
jgi:hypothetical protein